jgi:hypothetical protein
VTSPPKPNTLALSWFFGEYQKETLVLQPKYQRNPIWSVGQKCFLIDSLISGCPIPQVYININTSGTGAKKITTYEVVDGQQRLRTIIEYINGDWPLLGGIEKSYPVSDEYLSQVNRRYSDLPDRLQNAIWDYPLAVQEIRGWDDIAIRAMFRRLNYVNERLNAQELRHSQYFGEFNSAVEHLARNDFWDEIKLFSRRDSERMKDVEFISELFVIVLDGIQEGQSTLDKFYADYDVVFPNRSRLVARFNQAIESLSSIKELIATSRFHKKADFYALFAACVERVKTANGVIDLSPHRQELSDFAQKLDGDSETFEGDVRTYYNSVAEGANKAPKRRTRRDILMKLT